MNEPGVHQEVRGPVRKAEPSGPLPGEEDPQSAFRDSQFARGWHPGALVALVRGQVVLWAIIAMVIIFALLTLLIISTNLQPTSWDKAITHDVQLLPQPVIGDTLIAVSQPGFEPWNWVFPMVIVGVMLLFRWVLEAVCTTVAALGSLSSEIVKNIVDRPRPTPAFAHISQVLHTYSFPSGHVTEYTAVFGFIFYLAFTLLPRRSVWRWVLLVFTGLMVLLVGISRVYMGQHWASDALGGYALGFTALLIAVEIHRLWLKKHPRAEGSGAKEQSAQELS